jgi:predicted aminopeptidase
MNFPKIVLYTIFLAGLSGCESVRYYTQAVSGQISILNKRRAIHHLLADPLTPEHRKDQFLLVLNLRMFAKDELHLPVKNQYLGFVEVNRPYVLWNIYAAPEFSFSPKTWCYPVVGSAAYRGYFSEPIARRYADQLRKEGYDVYVGGVTAYSTLGWLDDPVFSTIIDFSEVRLAALIFHELAHQILYVNDDTTFNESFATAVEKEGLRRWMASRGNNGAYLQYLQDSERHRRVNRLLIEYRKKLDKLYQQDMALEEKRHKKRGIIKKLKQTYLELKQDQQGYDGYDEWFAQPINNAKLNTVSIYNDLVPSFLNLLQHAGGDLPSFYERCRKLSKYTREERMRRLNKEIDKGLN